MATANQIAMLRKIIETSDFKTDNGNYASIFVKTDSDKGILGSLAAVGLVYVSANFVNGKNDSWVELSQTALDLISDEPEINLEPLSDAEQERISKREIEIINSGLSAKNKRALFEDLRKSY